MKNKKATTRNPEAEFDVDRLRRSIALSPEEKLRHLEMLNEFLAKLMPDSSKAVWDRLKRRGW